METATQERTETLLVSVIVPVYNTAPWLRKCLDSIINQTYRNLEIICVNDGSTDDSASILDEYAAKDARIKVIHQANAGVSVARNKGLDIAVGEYVSFVDSDDWLEPETYERALNRMSDDVDMVWYGTAVEGDITADYRKVLEHHLLVGKSGLSGWIRVCAHTWGERCGIRCSGGSVSRKTR